MKHRIITFPPELRRIHMLDSALKMIKVRWPEADPGGQDDAASPVFLLAAGWRSGSTLLQRLICSSGDIVMWGEPLGEAAIIPKLADSLSVFSAGWPPDSYVANDLSLRGFADNWIANVTPPIPSLRLAHRALLEQWLAEPADKIYGKARWGLKEVRLTIEHARYLKWLYPNARFVFIYRNLFDAYLSWRGNSWLSAWPGYCSYSPIAYAKHWKLLLKGFLDGYQELNGMLVRYEDLISGRVDLDALSAHVGATHIDPSVLDKRIASPDDLRWKRKKKNISLVEKLILSAVAGPTLERAGYR